MTLQVDFDHFADAVQRHLSAKSVYACRSDHKTRLTASDPEKNLIVSCVCRKDLDEAKAILAQAGLELHEGVWQGDGEPTSGDLQNLPYIAAIAYHSEDEMPGVWVDAFPEMPTQAMALKGFYEEFRQTGEVGEVSFEEFVRQANPNVVIVSPMELDSFLDAKNGG